MTFDDYSFHEKLLQGIKEMGFVEPTPVQDQTFTLIAQGKDIEAQSQTGTGKTAAFLISGFQLMMTDPKFQGRKMLVIAPTRELADQIEKEASLIGKHLSLRIGAFYGGVGYAQQEKLIAEGVDVMIGTPGRLLDFVGSGKMNFKDVGILVIDEADRLFDMGFYPDLRQMLRTMSDPEDRRTMLFSATLSSQVMNLAWEYMRNPGQIVIEPENVTVEKITQELYHVSTEEKFGVLLSLLKKENPGSCIIFTNTKHTAVRVSKRLEMNGYSTEYIMGDLPQSKRLKIIADMKAGKTPVLVATDVAARGLHINSLDLVVNYDLPTEAENYVHRIGRTARAGKTGKSVSLACEKYVYGLKAIEDYTKLKIPVAWFNEADLVEDKSKGVHINVDDDERSVRGGRDRRDRSSGSERRGGPNASRRDRDGRRDRPAGDKPVADRPAGDRPSGERDRDRDRRGRGADKPLVIRSSSLVNEATGVKFLKDGMDSKPSGRRDKKSGKPNAESKKPNDSRQKSSQGERIAAAAAATGNARGGRDRGKPNASKDAHAKPRNEDQRGKPRDRRPAEAPRPSPNDAKKAPRGKKPALKDRLDYYKSKYGEDFKPVDVKSEKKPSFWDKVAGFFGGKKKGSEE